MDAATDVLILYGTVCLTVFLSRFLLSLVPDKHAFFILCRFKDPMKMPCGHTVCLECFNASPSCPFCKTKYSRDQLVVNERFQALLRKTCESCLKEGIQKTEKCGHCGEQVCATCAKKHADKVSQLTKMLTQWHLWSCLSD